MSLLTDQIVKNSHILAGIYFIFLKNVLDQTLQFFNTKFRNQLIVKQLVHTSLLLIITLRFTCGKRKIW